MKETLTYAPILQLSDFNKTFDQECNAGGIGIGGMLLQGGNLIAYFNEKLYTSSLNYCSYHKELYAFVEDFKKTNFISKSSIFIMIVNC